MGRMRLTAMLVVAVLAIAACSNDGASQVATDTAATPTTAEAPTPTAEPTPSGDGLASSDDPQGADEVDEVVAGSGEPTAVAAPTPTPTTDEDTGDGAVIDGVTPDASGTAPPAEAPSACSASRAGEPVASEVARADADGDGRQDDIITYAIDNGSGDPAWRLRVETASGASYDTALRVEPGFGAMPEPLGGADVDGDGATEELFTTVGAGASATIVAIHVIEGCDLVQAHQNDFATTFPVGGTVANLAGLQCVDSDANGVNNGIVAWIGEADPTASGTWQLFGTEYVLRGSELTEVAYLERTASIVEADFVYSQLTCGSVVR